MKQLDAYLTSENYENAVKGTPGRRPVPYGTAPTATHRPRRETVPAMTKRLLLG